MLARRGAIAEPTLRRVSSDASDTSAYLTSARSESAAGLGQYTVHPGICQGHAPPEDGLPVLQMEAVPQKEPFCRPADIRPEALNTACYSSAMDALHEGTADAPAGKPRRYEKVVDIPRILQVRVGHRLIVHGSDERA